MARKLICACKVQLSDLRQCHPSFAEQAATCLLPHTVLTVMMAMPRTSKAALRSEQDVDRGLGQGKAYMRTSAELRSP